MRIKLPPAEPVFTFRHAYHKLGRPVFTTIRGKGHFKKLKVGQRVLLECPSASSGGIWRGQAAALVTGLELRRVRELPLELLKADAEWPGNTIGEHQHFINLLNSFRAPAWDRVTMDSELTVITLEKIQP